MTDFRKLKEWDKAHNLTVAVYKITKSFPESEILGITQQIRLACADIPIKIARGCQREDKEDKIDFLYEAIDATIEAEYYLLLCYELDYLNIADYDRLVSRAVEVKGLLESYLRRIEDNV